MRVASVITNRTCNQNCGFCTARRPFEDATSASVAVIARIDEAMARGAEEIVLTGGEPTLRRDLPALVAAARRGGARVVLETNAALVDDGRAARLARAGLDRARVHMPRWGEAADAITRDPGGFSRSLAGMRALAAAGIAIELGSPVLRDNAADLPLLPAAVASSGLPVERLILRVVVEAPDPAVVLRASEAARVIAATAQAARRVGLEVLLHPGALPPCLFDDPHKVAHLFSLGAGGNAQPDCTHVEACAACSARPICPGIPRAILAREPDLSVQPIKSERTRRRLTTIGSVDEQVAREVVVRDVRRRDDGTTVRENIVRVVFHCNQDCGFCFVSTHLPAPKRAVVEDAIREIGELGGVLTISGGEPTLVADLPDLVALGRRSGASSIELQTNAIRLADPALTSALAKAGLDVALVSLHASNAELSDRITRAPGTWVETVRGIDQVHATSIDVHLTFVICTDNAANFPEFVRFVAARWPRAGIALPIVAPSTDVVPLDRSLIPRYSDVVPHVERGLLIAHELGVRVRGFESMCGLPLCLAPGGTERYFELAEAPPDAGEFIKPEACGRCALETRCFGLRRGYAALYGTDELRPVAIGANSSQP